ncbi:MAG: hypothetical protein JWO98_5154 [Frankiales bacterium]|nr:hypothetical protein [Frankiales bacterium]
MLVAPELADGFAGRVIEDVVEELQARHPEVRWDIETVEDGLVEPPADDAEIVRAARHRLLARGWDLAISLTDLPLHVARRPVVAHASPVHGVAILSVPALGTVGARRRARDAVLRLIDALLGEDEDDEAGPGRTRPTGRSQRLTRRLSELGSDAVDAEAIRFTARVLTGHLRLLTGMILANRPWRLAARLTRALTAAGATGAVALVSSDIWRIADAAGWVRLLAIALGAVCAITATLILGAGLWERAPHRRMRQQVALFNLATTGTVLIGVLSLYASLAVLVLPAALLLLPPDALALALRHPVTMTSYLKLAWLAASLATLGGALGAGLETDEAVHQAAYTYRTSSTTERDAVADPPV